MWPMGWKLMWASWINGSAHQSPLLHQPSLDKKKVPSIPQGRGLRPIGFPMDYKCTKSSFPA